MRNHIATAPVFSFITGKRIGTQYLYSMQGIREYQTLCLERHGKNPTIRWRNDEVKRETLANYTAIERARP